MWELIVNGATLEVGNRLRYRIQEGEIEIVNECEIIQTGEIYFCILTTKNNGVNIPEENQATIKYSFSKLNQLGFERWVNNN